MKFPRTKHLFNLGAATRDDLRMDVKDAMSLLANHSLTLSCEEKVDGANLGIRWERGKLAVQNRSKDVTDEFQFRKLPLWLSAHNAALDKIVNQGKRVFYGEWMAFKHCIKYTKLPDYFLAFDVLDVESGRFLSRPAFHALLQEANEAGASEGEHGIVCVRELELPPGFDRTKDEWEKLCLGSTSLYHDGLIEGIYIRWDEKDWLHERAKLVSPGFQQSVDASGHWSKAIPEKNMLATYDLPY